MANLTKEQQEAVDKEGTNIIVSAGAGSGKTAVLTERVIRKLKDGVSIDKLLILTFTNEAAGEMKDRIRNKIKATESLKEQLNYIDNAYITTFDSFAFAMVRKYHYLLNLSKDIAIIDQSIMNIKRKEYLDEIFDDLYEEENHLFLRLINDFCTKNDNDIKKQILKINNAIDLKYDKKEYLSNYLDNFYSTNYVNKITNIYLNYILSLKDEIKDIYERILTLEDSKTIEKYEVLTPLVKATTYENIKNNLDISLPRIVKNSKLEKNRLKELIDLLKELTIYDTLNDAQELYQSSKDYVTTIILIINKLDQKINNYKNDNNAYEFVDISKMAIDIVNNYEDIRLEIKNYYNEIMIEPGKLFQLEGGQKRRKLALTFGALERDINGIAEKGTEYSFKELPRSEYIKKITEILLKDPKLSPEASDELKKLLSAEPFDELRLCNIARNHLLEIIGTFPAEWDLVIAPHKLVNEDGTVDENWSRLTSVNIININNNDVDGKASFGCEIEIDI